jgi:hypothetical protein
MADYRQSNTERIPIPPWAFLESPVSSHIEAGLDYLHDLLPGLHQIIGGFGGCPIEHDRAICCASVRLVEVAPGVDTARTYSPT